MAKITIAYNAVNAKLIKPTPEIRHLVSAELSFSVNGAEYSDRFGSGGWDGRSSFFKYSTNSFPSGFVRRVTRSLKRSGHKVNVVSKPLPPPLGEERPLINSFGYTDEYSYQPETVDRLIERGGMIAQLATGAGKSNVACIAIARIKRPTLFITTRGVLMYQMKKSLETSLQFRKDNGEDDLSTEVGVIGDGIWSPKRVTVAMVQTLASKLKDPDPFSDPRAQAKQARIRDKVKLLLSKFELVILEEAHEASGDSYFNILKSCVNARYRLALTATPFMKDEEEANMKLLACVGPIGIVVTEKELIDKGILAKPYFKFIDLPCPPKLYRGTGWQRAYKLGITENKYRNDHIIRECTKLAKYNLTAITLVQHTAHGKTLAKLMKVAGLRAQFIKGEDSQDTRDAALKKLENNEIDVLIGTSILDVGVDVPSVGAIILAGGYKAEVSLRQRIGRGMRRKRKGPNVIFIFDFTDAHNSHTRDHANQRRSIIESTEGFAENILKKNDDFDYAIFTK